MGKYLIVLSFLLVYVTNCASNGIQDKPPIHGFTQFGIYTGTNYLGFTSSTDNIEDFDTKVWTGVVEKVPIKNNIIVTYSSKTEVEAALKFLGIASVGAKAEEVKNINLILINPREIKLVDRTPLNASPSLLKRKFVGSILYAEMLEMQVVTQSGKILKGNAVAKHFSLSASYKSKVSEGNFYTAFKAYIGYKLLEPTGDITYDKLRYKFRLFSNAPKSEIHFKIDSKTSDVKSTGWSLIGQTPYKKIKVLTIFGLTFDNSEKVTLQIKAIAGNKEKIKTISLRELLANREVIHKFKFKGYKKNGNKKKTSYNKTRKKNNKKKSSAERTKRNTYSYLNPSLILALSPSEKKEE